MGGSSMSPRAPHLAASAAWRMASRVVPSAILSSTGMPARSTAYFTRTSFSSNVTVLASPREPPIMMPLTPAWAWASRLTPKAGRSRVSFVVNLVVTAGYTPFQFILMDAFLQIYPLSDLRRKRQLIISSRILTNLPFQIVIIRLCDAYVHKLADRQSVRTLDHDLIVHLYRIKFGTAKISAGLLFIDQDLEDFPDFLLVLFVGYFLLYFHDLLRTLLFDLRGDIVVKLVRGRTFLMRIGKDPDAVETMLAQEILQLLYVRIRFPGEAGDQGCPQTDAGDFFPDGADQVGHVLPGELAAHSGQHPVAGVLKRHVEVVADIGPVAHNVEDLQREFGRVSIVQPDPMQAGDISEAMEQIGEGPPPVNIEAVIGQFLRDKHDLFYAFTYEALRFFHEVFDRAADMPAAHQRDGAEGAGPVATFGNFQIGVVFRRREEPFAQQFGLVIS